MKLTEERTHFETNLDESQSIEFGIGDASVVIEILRNRLYENKVRTLVQEYMCNARDAHREIQQTKSIEVTFPTHADLNFTVRDYGPGISPERMSTVFVLYGASTKRTSNKQTGGFGIGAKSAWSYADSFTITTYIDGTKRVYLAHVGVNKNGRVDVVSETTTNESNGTGISIGVSKNDLGEFCKAIVRGIMYWTPEEYPTFKGEKEYAAILVSARKVGLSRFMGSNLSAASAYDYTSNYRTQIVIDGVPYPMPSNVPISEHSEIVNRGYCHDLTVFISNGFVQVSASREKIDDSDFSKKGLKQVFVAALAEFEKAQEDWEESIVDTKSLIAAKDTSTGFCLTTAKHIDFVGLERGQLSLKTTRKNSDNLDERLFSCSSVDSNPRSYNNFNLHSEHKYYMLRTRSVKISDINTWVHNQKDVKKIDLVTILGQVPVTTKDPKTGAEWIGYKRDDKLVVELTASLERLGFKNILELLPRAVVGPKEKTAPIIGNMYRMCHDGEEKVLAKELVEKKGVWIYFLGAKHEQGYDHFHRVARGLRDIGVIEEGFRVTKKFAKQVADEAKFVECSEFIAKWTPTKSLVLKLLDLQRGSSEYRLRYSAMCNFIEYYKDNEDESLHKVAVILCNTNASKSQFVTEKIHASKEYKEGLKAIRELNDFIDRYLPLMDVPTKNRKHMNEYITWGLDKATQDGVSLSLLEALY
jgi:hypothetical protein